ncbi:MAG: hypothetical protein ACRDFX_08120 [Chloroflexota bacterium]
MMRFRDRFDRSKRTPTTRSQRIGFAFFWLIVVMYAYFIPTQPSWNSESHLYPAFALVDHHTLNIDAYQRRLGDKSYANGHWYGDKAPGLTLLAVPVYALLREALPAQKALPYEAFPHQKFAIPRSTIYLRYAITYILVILPSALFAVFLWLFLCRFVSAGWALLATTVYSLGTIAWTFSSLYFSHQIAAILLFVAFALLYRRAHDGSSGRLLRWAPVLAGALCGLAVISEYPTAVIVVLLMAYTAITSSRRLRDTMAFAAGLCPPAIAGLAYNLAAFGHPLATGYMYEHSSLYQSTVKGGFLGFTNPLSYGAHAPSLLSAWQITFGAYRGIFLVSPVLLLFVAALVFMWRKRTVRAEFWLCLVIVVGYFLLDASRDWAVSGWSGGNSVASRHLVPAIPFMVLPLVFGFTNSLFRRIFLIAGGVSIGIMFIIVSSVGLFSYTDQNPLVHEALRHFSAGKMQVNWGNTVGLTGFASLLPLAVIAAALSIRIGWLLHSSHETQMTRREPLVTGLEAS